MEREEAIQVVRGLTETTYFDDRELEGLRTLIPELTESEDERIRKFIQNELVCLRATEIEGSERYNEITSAIAYLEKQKEQKPAEWSEEDEAMIKSILYVLESYVSQSESASSPSLITSYPTYYKEIDWLKSLCPSWKPSEEQMNYLTKAIATLGEEGDCKTAAILNELRIDLKKL